MRRQGIRLVILAMVMTLIGSSIPAGSTFAAQNGTAQPVGMVSGSWRMLAWQVVLASSFPDHGLEARDGKNWAILIADMTNTGITGTIPVADLTLSDTAADPMASSKASRALGLAEITDDGQLTVAENGTARVAFVFDYAGDPMVLQVGLGGQRVSVAATVSDSLDVARLPLVATGMQLEVATIQAIPRASSLSVTIQQTAEARDIVLAGILAPPADQCYGAESVQLVGDITGGTVWIETIPGVDAPTVWYNDVAGASFGLIDQALVSAGAADADGSGIYGTWLAPMADQVEAQKAGLWQNCTSADGGYINPPTPTPIPTPSAEEVRKAYTWVDTRDLVSRPFLFKGEKIAVSGEVFTLQIEAAGTFMQIWVDTPNGREAVVVYALGNQTPGLYEGMWVTVYGTGDGTFSGTNRFGATITQPQIRADIVDY